MSEEMNLYKRCKNIFKFHGVDMGGGESAPEVENAIETHGLGWTDTEEVPAINITWDGNTEDREHFTSADVTYVKVADAIFNDISELYGAKIVCASEEVILDDNNCLYDEGYYMLNYFGIYLPIDDEDISAGLYFIKGRNYYTSSLTKEATTEEVVHQIDQKYIPGGSGGAMVVDVEYGQSGLTADTTYEEIWEAASNGVPVLAAIRINGHIASVLAMTQAAPTDGSGVTFFGATWVVDGSIKSKLMVDNSDHWEIGELPE